MVAAIGFLVVWFVVATVIGAITANVIPTPSGRFVIAGLDLDWRDLPGTILGLVAGIHSFRASVQSPKMNRS